MTIALLLAGVLLTLTGLAVVAALTRPRLSYHRQSGLPLAAFSGDPELARLREDPHDPGLVVITLTNHAPHAARLRRVSYQVRAAGAPELVTDSIRELVQYLHARCQASDDWDYHLLSLVPGAYLPARDPQRLAVLIMPMARRLALLRVTMTCVGPVGWWRVRKQIDVVPVRDSHRRLPPPVPVATPGPDIV